MIFSMNTSKVKGKKCFTHVLTLEVKPQLAGCESYICTASFNVSKTGVFFLIYSNFCYKTCFMLFYWWVNLLKPVKKEHTWVIFLSNIKIINFTVKIIFCRRNIKMICT